jgi:pimeloyl-ACP methyl ester carboxylesterase
MMHTIGKYILIRLSRGNHLLGREKKEIAHFDDLQEYHILHHPGMIRSFASTVCHFKFGAFAPCFRKINETHKSKVVAIWGQLDQVVPTDLSEELSDLIPSMRLAIKENTSHSIVMEDPEFVVQTLHLHFSGLK